MTTNNFDVTTFDVAKFDLLLERGLSRGLGATSGQMCIEAAICHTLGLPHNDDPQCVAESVRCFKIALNDSNWSSPQARAKGLRDLGLAQLGSKGIVSDKDFVTILSRKVIQVLIPKLFRQIFTNQECLDVANRCETEGTSTAAIAAANAASAASAAYSAAIAAAYSAAIAAANAASYASYATAYAAYAAASAAASAASAADEEYLILVAKLALDTLRELTSPGLSLV
jgi:hypothetical protein